MAASQASPSTNPPRIRRFSRRTFWRRGGLVVANSFNSMLVPVFGIVVSLLVVRLASVELWGAFVDIMIWVQLAAMVVGWGNKEFLLRAFSRQPAQMASLWQSNLTTRLVLLLPAALGLALLGWPASRWLLALVWLLGLAIAQSHDVLVVYRRAFVLAAAVELGATALTVAGVLVVAAAPRGDAQYSVLAPRVDVLIAIFAAAAVVRALALSFRFRSDVWQGLLRRRGNIALCAGRWRPADLRLAFPFFALGFTGMLQSRIDLYAVNHFLTPTEVGAYQVFSSFLLYVQALAAFTLTPFLKGVFRLGYDAIARVSARLFLFGLLITGPALLLIYFTLTYLYHLPLPAPFYALGALYVLPIFYYLPIIYALYKADRQHIVLAVNLCGLAASLVLAVVFLPRIGLIGAILAAALVRCGVFAFYFWMGRQLRGRHAPVMS